MPFCKRSIVEIDENSKLSEIPDVGTWKPGALDTNPRCFDLLCTGKVQINSNDYKLKLNVSATDKIPNFFTKNGAGEIVFAEPKPMCTLKMPRGHYGTIIVRLKNVSTEQTSVKDYVCLGVRENGIITDVIYGNNGYKYIDITDASRVDLVPLISTTKLPEYTKAEIGTKVTFSNTNFDFGTVYRITIDDEQVLEWKKLQQTGIKKLQDIDNNGTWYNESSGVGIGPVKGKGVRMLAINNNTGKLASSVDGNSWEDEGCISNENTGVWLTGPVYGNGIWCAVNTEGIVRYSVNETRTWLTSSVPSEESIRNLALGNGMFMTIGGKAKVYASADATSWRQIGEVNCNDVDEFRALYYDNNICACFCIASTGEVYTSRYGRGTWKYIVSDDEEKNLHSIESHNWFTTCYAHGYRYISTNEPGSVARSSNGKDWERVVNCTGSGYYNISFYNERFYLLSCNGLDYYVGTFK